MADSTKAAEGGMKLTRKQAILAVLMSPAAFSSIGQDSNGTFHANTVSRALWLRLALADKEEADKDGGIYKLEVTYQEKTVQLSAKEIWEALQP